VEEDLKTGEINESMSRKLLFHFWVFAEIIGGRERERE